MTELASALRRAEARIEDYERRLAEAERDRQKLEEEFARREQRFDALREKVGELTEALESEFPARRARQKTESAATVNEHAETTAASWIPLVCTFALSGDSWHLSPGQRCGRS